MSGDESYSRTSQLLTRSQTADPSIMESEEVNEMNDQLMHVEH